MRPLRLRRSEKEQQTLELLPGPRPNAEPMAATSYRFPPTTQAALAIQPLLRGLCTTSRDTHPQPQKTVVRPGSPARRHRLPDLTAFDWLALLRPFFRAHSPSPAPTLQSTYAVRQTPPVSPCPPFSARASVGMCRASAPATRDAAPRSPSSRTWSERR